MHRPQQAGLSDRGHGVGGHHHVGLDRDLHIGMPVVDRHLADTADDDVADQHRRIRLQRRDIRDLDVVGDGVRVPVPPLRAAAVSSTPGRRSRSVPALRTTRRRPISSFRRIMMAASLPPAAGAHRGRAGGAVCGSSILSTVGGPAAGMLEMMCGGRRGGALVDHRRRRNRGRVVAGRIDALPGPADHSSPGAAEYRPTPV